LFDLDHFKKVNDTYGHQAGDQVLIEICSTVDAKLRTEDVLARYGGEEFAISLRGVDREGTRMLAERIREGNERKVRFEAHQIPVTSSFGCAQISDCEGDPTPEKLIAIADRRLYLAKQGGRNCVVNKG
jgi:diguanylate cyclase (GGDEF)-like protein